MDMYKAFVSQRINLVKIVRNNCTCSYQTALGMVERLTHQLMSGALQFFFRVGC